MSLAAVSAERPACPQQQQATLMPQYGATPWVPKATPAISWHVDATGPSTVARAAVCPQWNRHVLDLDLVSLCTILVPAPPSMGITECLIQGHAFHSKVDSYQGHLTMCMSYGAANSLRQFH